MNLLQDLKWRYSTKKMNGNSVPQEKVDYIIEAARLAPSSSGLLPFRIIQISSPELKTKIQPIAMGQSQIVDSSHLLVFVANEEYTKEYIESIFTQQEIERGLPKGYSDNYKNQVLEGFQTWTRQKQSEHAARQSYIGLAMAIMAAAEQRVDATPMEGFNNEELDDFLNLESLGLKSVTILALGYRDVDNDWAVNLKKVRRKTEDFVIDMR